MSRYYNSYQYLGDNNGDPVVGGKKNFYVSPSSTTRKNTYQDAALTIPHANPVIALADGTFPTIFLEPGVYNVITTDENDVVVNSQDNVIGVIDPGNINYTNSLTGSVERTVQARLEDYVSVADFGAVGDGSNESTELQAAMDAVPDGGTLVFPPATYRSDSPLVANDKAITVFAYGATLDFSNNSTTLAQAITIQGSDSATTTTATADIVQGAASITVSSESGFSAGDYVSILSNTELLGSQATYTKGEIVRIISTAANTLNLEGGTRDSYDATGPTVTITKINMIDKPGIYGLTVIGSGVSANRHIGAAIASAISPRIVDCEFFDCSSTGADIAQSVNGVIDRCFADNCNDVTGPTGYGFSLSNLAMDCTVSNSSTERCRHGFNTGGLLPVWNWLLVNSHFRDQLASSTTFYLSTHANGVEGAYINNSVDNAYGGISCSGPKNQVIGNKATNINTTHCYGFDQDGPWNSTVSNNRGEGISGISVPPYTAFVSTTVVENNYLYGTAVNGGTISGGITAQADHMLIKGNTVINHSHGIRTDGDGTRVTQNNVFDTTNSTPTTPFAIRVLSGTDVLVDNNYVTNENSTTMTNAILIDAAATNTKIVRNDLSDSTAALISDAGTGTQEIANMLDGVLQNFRTSTTAALTDITNAINTTNKVPGELIRNTNTGVYVYAINNSAGGVWVDTAGATAHTPV